MRRFILKLKRRGRLERDLDEELRFHREMSRGHFGNATRIREEAWELWTFSFLENLIRDLRYACRALAKSPSFSVAAVLTLGLGIGLNTAVFTLYDSMTYRLLPVRAPAEIVRVIQQSGNVLNAASLSYAEFENLSGNARSFLGVIATLPARTVLGTVGTAETVRKGIHVRFVAGDYFGTLGVQCNPGRAFQADEPGVVVVSHAFWKRRLNADPSIAGKIIVLHGVQLTILGVAPETFYGTDVPPRMPDVWMPLSMESQVLPGADWVHDNQAHPLHVLARLRPGIGIEQASAELQQVAGRLTPHVTPGDGQKSWLAATRATVFQTNMGASHDARVISFILMGAVAVVLLIGCVNLVNLMLSRNAAREKEIAVRLAIGASRGQIVRQLCAESVVLGLAGGAIGLVLSVLLCDWARIGVFAMLERLSSDLLGGMQLNVAPDWRVFAYTFGLSILTGALVGIWPAVYSTKAELGSSLKAAGVQGTRHNFLLTAQIAACLILLAGSGLLFRGAWQARSANPGFSVDHVLMMSVDAKTMGDVSGGGAAVRRVLERVRSIPQVASTAFVDRAPFLGTGSDRFTSDGNKEMACLFNRVSGGYFDTLKIPILAGRSFSQAESERGDAEVVVSESAAQFYWPGESPLGHRISVAPRLKNDLPRSFYTVIGVAKDVRNTFLSKIDRYYLYFPKPFPDAFGLVLVRTRNRPELSFAALRNALSTGSPALAQQSYLITLESGPVQVQKLMVEAPATIAMSLGLLALLLASVGVYGVVSYLVAQKTRTIGICMAIGAQKKDVIWMVLRESLRSVALGAGIGLLGALCISGMLKAVMEMPDLPDLTYQAGVFNPVIFLIVVAILGAAVGLASFAPVRRAIRVDPAAALRNE